MTAPMQRDEWLAGFPLLRDIEPEARRRLLEAASLAEVPAGTVVFREGGECHNYLLVLDGAVRVQKVSETGREIVLYRVESGESCILTTTCLLSQETYDAEGIAETPVRAVVLPRSVFEDLLARSAVFRHFVFASYAVRLSDLMLLIEEVAFGRIDVRLADCLMDRRGNDGAVHGTHQDLATELGTAREVVSRQLKEFERRGWVALRRGRVDILAADRLRELARRARA